MREEEEYREGEGRAEGSLGQQKSGSLSQTQIPQSFGSLSQQKTVHLANSGFWDSLKGLEPRV